MKAIVATNYGPPDVLELRELDKPIPKDNELLIKVYASSVTSGDARVRSLNVPTGFGIITRMIFGFQKPRKPVLGMDFSGVVESVGKNVKLFQKGDQVFGTSNTFGSYAEYLTIAEDKAVTQKPANLTYEEAAGIPFGALTSLVYLRNFGKIQQRERILINGASGSLGSSAVQLAKHFGANVTAVCSTSNVEWVKELGADEVIDYTKEDFTNRDERYDIIFDTVGTVTFADCKHVLKGNGRFLMAVAGIPQFLNVLWTSMTGRKKAIAGVAVFKKKDLTIVKELIETEKLKPVIDRRYTLDRTAEAHRYVDKGHKKGNVIITVKHSEQVAA